MQKLVLTLLLLCIPSLRAATPDELVAQGRLDLELRRTEAAHAKFAQALQQSPTHQHALFFHAATLLALAPNDPQVALALDQLQIGRTNLSTFEWRFSLPMDESDKIIFPKIGTAQLVADTIHDSIVPRLLQASEHLQKLSSSFLVSLSSNETKKGAVTIDYADTQTLRAGLLAVASLGTWLSASSFDVNFAALTHAFTNRAMTAESFLKQYPSFLQVSASSRVQSAREHFIAAIDQYNAASDALRARPAGLERLFMLDQDGRADEVAFRETLEDVRRSLLRSVVLRHHTNITVRASRFFAGQLGLRDFLPVFVGDEMEALSISPHGVVEGDLGLLEDPVADITGLDIAPRLVIEHGVNLGVKIEIAGESGVEHYVLASPDLQRWEPLMASQFGFMAPLRVRPSGGFASLMLAAPEKRIFLRAVRNTYIALAPVQVAPTSLNNKTLYFTPAGATTRPVTFAPVGNDYTIPQVVGPPVFGTYSYSASSNNNWRATLALNELAPEHGARNVAILHFSTETAGTYELTRTPAVGGQSTKEVGTFGMIEPKPFPLTLTGNRLTIYTAAGSEWFDLASDSTFTGEVRGSSGTYFVQSLPNGRVKVILDFASPPTMANDEYDLTLMATMDAAGSFSGSLKLEGQPLAVTGAFNILTPEPQTAALAGKRLNMFSAQGGEAIEFGANTFNAEVGGMGTYTVQDLSSGRLRVIMDFTAPASFASDEYNLVLNFTNEAAGTFIGNLRYEGADHPVTGSYTLESKAGPLTVKGSAVSLAFIDGGTELLTFFSGAAFTSDFTPGAGGTYIETSATALGVTVTINYDTPPPASNDRATIILVKTRDSGGTFTGSANYEGIEQPLSGTWSSNTAATPPPPPPDPPTSAFTLINSKIQVQYNGAGQELFELHNGGTFKSDFLPGGGGTYSQVNVASNELRVLLNYDTPTAHANDSATIVFTQASATGGTIFRTGMYSGDAFTLTGSWSFVGLLQDNNVAPGGGAPPASSGSGGPIGSIRPPFEPQN